MAEFENRSYAQTIDRARVDAHEIDAGLRAYMLRIYNYMAAGIAITGAAAGVTAYAAMNNPAVAQALYASPLKWVIMLAPLAMVFLFAARVHKMSVSGAQLTFWIFAAIMGVSISSIFLVFTGNSIAQIFFVTAAAFGGLSLYGYTTQKDISGWGSFLIMGLIGIILASIVNIFIGSGALQFAISVIGVLIFSGLTAYDTQRLKNEYIYGLSGADAATAGRTAIMGALSLYLNFINMFMMLLQLFGDRE